MAIFDYMHASVHGLCLNYTCRSRLSILRLRYSESSLSTVSVGQWLYHAMTFLTKKFHLNFRKVSKSSSGSSDKTTTAYCRILPTTEPHV